MLSQHLKQHLTLPSSAALLQYVDDILIAADNRLDCLTATEELLKVLSKCGYKALILASIYGCIDRIDRHFTGT